MDLLCRPCSPCCSPAGGWEAPHHPPCLDAHKLVAALLKALDDVAHQAAVHTVGLHLPRGGGGGGGRQWASVCVRGKGQAGWAAAQVLGEQEGVPAAGCGWAGKDAQTGAATAWPPVGKRHEKAQRGFMKVGGGSWVSARGQGPHHDEAALPGTSSKRHGGAHCRERGKGRKAVRVQLHARILCEGDARLPLLSPRQTVLTRQCHAGQRCRGGDPGRRVGSQSSQGRKRGALPCRSRQGGGCRRHKGDLDGIRVGWCEWAAAVAAAAKRSTLRPSCAIESTCSQH